MGVRRQSDNEHKCGLVLVLWVQPSVGLMSAAYILARERALVTPLTLGSCA